MSHAHCAWYKLLNVPERHGDFTARQRGIITRHGGLFGNARGLERGYGMPCPWEAIFVRCVSVRICEVSVANLQIRSCFCFLVVSAMLPLAKARADGCPTPADEITTDRPDVTNSSLVVPVGSFQSENGINLSSRDGGRSLDGTNTRWRLGIAPCFEVLVDLPTYFANIKSPGTRSRAQVANQSSTGED
jgi:hypothetical protein